MRIFMYLDDGAGSNKSYQVALQQSHQVKSDLRKAGFTVSDKKDMVPRQREELLGFVVDLEQGVFQVTAKRIEKMKTLVRRMQRASNPTARELARLTGTLVSMGLALGPIVRLRTRAIFRLISEAASWNSRLVWSPEAADEVQFWRSQFDTIEHQSIWPTDPEVAAISYSDASDSAWGGLSLSCGKMISHGNFSVQESGPITSSTLRELLAVKYVISSFQSELRGKCVRHFSDNQSAVSILAIGSKRQHLHEVSLSIASLCAQNSIRLLPEWIPREENEQADAISKFIDSDDWQLDRQIFLELDSLWGPHSIDLFASFKSSHLSTFASRFWNPGSFAVDAFTGDWSQQFSWIVPPPRLVGRVLEYMSKCAADGSLVIPFWPSAPWWPFLASNGVLIREVVDWRIFLSRPGMFRPASSQTSLFSEDPPKFHMLACRLCFCTQCAMADESDRTLPRDMAVF